MKKVKNWIINLYNTKGKSVGKYLLTNFMFAFVAYIAIILLSGTGFSFMNFAESILYAPVFAVLIIIVRAALKLIHKIIPMRTSIIKFIIDFLIFFFVWTALAYFMNKIPVPESNILQLIILIVLDMIYIAITVFMFLSHKITNKINNKDNKIDEDGCQ